MVRRSRVRRWSGREVWGLVSHGADIARRGRECGKEKVASEILMQSGKAGQGGQSGTEPTMQRNR